jgi:hypothetical protein
MATCNLWDSLVTFPIDVGVNPPSGLDYYNHSAIPEFNGLIQAVTGNIKQGIIAYTMNASFDSVLQKNYFLTQKYGRVRDVCTATDGSVYFIAHDRDDVDIRKISNPLFSKVNDLEEELFSFYPNPGLNELYINSGNENLEIFIRDLSGKLIFSGLIQAYSEKVNINALPAGCYLISAKSIRGKISNKKLIVVR